jgi:hypothetical protein
MGSIVVFVLNRHALLLIFCCYNLKGFVHYGWLGKSSNSKEVLRINYPVDWRQEHKSPLRHMLGMTVLVLETLCTFNCLYNTFGFLHIIVTIQCSAAISQLTKGRNKEEEGSELQRLAAEALLKDYKQRAPSKVPLITSMLKSMKLS